MFAQKLINWYNSNARNLPWRNTKNAYKVWLSEIILQQTRVDQGLNYYQKFIHRFPTIFELAKASEDEVLTLWQGLGYYSRARNLHFTAKLIVNQLEGKFPNSKSELLKLKGVGDYTASAIASFCFNEPTPVIDGNVYRFICRLNGIRTPIDVAETKAKILSFLNKNISKTKPDLFNQALMEMGALVCKPKKPDCKTCVFNIDCIARKKNLIDEIPYKSKKLKVKERFFNYLVIQQKNGLFFKKRMHNDIWKNMYDFPMIETQRQINQDELIKEIEYQFQFKPTNLQLISTGTHLLTHRKIYLNFWELKNFHQNQTNSWVLLNIGELHNIALPRAITRFIEKSILFEN